MPDLDLFREWVTRSFGRIPLRLLSGALGGSEPRLTRGWESALGCSEQVTRAFSGPVFFSNTQEEEDRTLLLTV